MGSGFALAFIFSPYYILGGRAYPVRHYPIALRLRDRKGHAILCIALNPQSGDSSGATLEVPSEALLHAQCSPFASKIHSKVNFLLICLQMCIFCSTFARFCITLSRSAIEAHRTRSASWKRSMPPLSPLTHEVRGGPVKARRTRSDRSTAREIRTLLAAKEYINQQLQQL